MSPMTDASGRRDGIRAAVLSVLILTLLLPPAAEAAEAGAIRFGARADAPPNSYRTADARFRGYAIDICEEVKKAYRARHHERATAEVYVLVTPSARHGTLLSGDIDAVCVPSPITESPMAAFDLSSFIFVPGGSGPARRP